jgi:hypothetical protein
MDGANLPETVALIEWLRLLGFAFNLTTLEVVDALGKSEIAGRTEAAHRPIASGTGPRGLHSTTEKPWRLVNGSWTQKPLHSRPYGPTEIAVEVAFADAARRQCGSI